MLIGQMRFRNVFGLTKIDPGWALREVNYVQVTGFGVSSV